MVDAVNSNIKINLGNGNNYINVASGNVDIQTGNGNQMIIADALNAATVKTGLFGEDTVIVKAQSANINTYDNDDIISFTGSTFNISAIGGNNLIEAWGGKDNLIFQNSITVGDGNNNIKSTAGNLDVNTGNGNQSIIIDASKNVNVLTGDGDQMIGIQNSKNVDILTGNGNQNILANAFNSAIVKTGDSTTKDDITVNAALGNITTGKGDDIIRFSGDSFNILTADGNNIISAIGNLGDKFSQNSITTGNGNQFIQTAGNNNTINIGNGAELLLGSVGDNMNINKGNIDNSLIGVWGNGINITGGEGNNSILTLDFAKDLETTANKLTNMVNNEGLKLEDGLSIMNDAKRLNAEFSSLLGYVDSKIVGTNKETQKEVLDTKEMSDIIKHETLTGTVFNPTSQSDIYSIINGIYTDSYNYNYTQSIMEQIKTTVFDITQYSGSNNININLGNSNNNALLTTSNLDWTSGDGNNNIANNSTFDVGTIDSSTAWSDVKTVDVDAEANGLATTGTKDRAGQEIPPNPGLIDGKTYVWSGTKWIIQAPAKPDVPVPAIVKSYGQEKAFHSNYGWNGEKWVKNPSLDEKTGRGGGNYVWDEKALAWVPMVNDKGEQSPGLKDGKQYGWDGKQWVPQPNSMYTWDQDTKKWCYVDPLIVDFNRNGSVNYNLGQGVDLDGNGTGDLAASNGDKMLAMSDLNGNGVIDAAEVFGDQTINPFTGQAIEAANGFDALKVVAQSAEKATGMSILNADGEVDLQALKTALATVGIGLGFISDDNNTELEDLAHVASININNVGNYGAYTDTDNLKWDVESVWV